LIETYIESLSHAEQERLRYLLKDLRLCNPTGRKFRFLDMGAGSGTMSVGVLLLFENAEGTLVDIQDRFAFPDKISESLSKRYRFVAWKNLADISDDRFDLVISTDVLEHIIDWQKAFQNLCSYLAVGGYLYIQVPSNYPSPNYPHLKVFKQRALGFLGQNNPNQHVRHGLSCKQLYDEGIRAGLKPLLAAEDYVVDSISHCDFKPRSHCLFQKQ
jgi:SAM-dependent methyltransferase